MGQSQSIDGPLHQATPEHLSHELAVRFATKCFTPLELSHFKDNFKTLADENDGLKYWKEETLCRFLCLPDVLGAGPVVYQMATYIGAFPFPSLAPSILTLEATVKVVVIMTERYNRILKRGRKDRIKLLFRSLAVFDRRMSTPAQEEEKPSMEALVEDQKPDDMVDTNGSTKDGRSHVAGFAIDEPVDNVDEDEDDDELALAALDSLDAIEVFKSDQRVDRKIHHAQIPVDNFRPLVLLLLALSALEPQDNIARYGEVLTTKRVQQLKTEVDSVMAAFSPDPISKVPGPISLQIDTDLSSAELTYTPDEGAGAFLRDPCLPQLSHEAGASSKGTFKLPPKLTLDISTLSIYGLSTPDPDQEGDDELTKQKKSLAWEEAEAERRRGINFGGDQEGARALLEMAGIVGQNRSGGSMG
ncbi:putative restriction of telomere capping protein 5 [Phaeomoniella chlamydospora]|uniref:Putative restriction of telomere capping protein 5 n=1 Tax=Phaeomoniella chlamydospora TaxID=158046 RepID=A0A0G2GMA5_PHACM|nr:putative restriction of telomere capping protein 5 [Phaeomoniella chlamydospora]